MLVSRENFEKYFEGDSQFELLYRFFNDLMNEDDEIFLSKDENFEILKRFRDLRNVIEYAKDDAINKAIKERKIEGKKEVTIEIANELLKNNVSIDIIANSSGLSKEEIFKIKGKLL